MTKSSPSEFPGFTRPTYTAVPDEVFDVLLPDLSKAELKVLLYIIRRTFGFGKDADAISVTQISEGITTRDGRVLDRGTGLSRSSVHLATKTLVEKGVLDVRQIKDEAGDFESNIYSLKFSEGVVRKSDDPSPKFDRGWSENRTGGSPNSGRGVVRKSDRQETVSNMTVNKNGRDLEEKDSTGEELPPPEILSMDQIREMSPEERLAQVEATKTRLKRLPRLS